MTPGGKAVLALAVEEARLCNQTQLDTEHLLLGLVREGQGLGAGMLESLGVNTANARRALAARLGLPDDYVAMTEQTQQSPVAHREAHDKRFEGDLVTETITVEPLSVTTPKVRFAAETWRRLQRAQEIATRLSQAEVAPEHILLAPLATESSLVPLFRELGLDLEQARQVVERVLRKEAPHEDTAEDH